MLTIDLFKADEIGVDTIVALLYDESTHGVDATAIERHSSDEFYIWEFNRNWPANPAANHEQFFEFLLKNQDNGYSEGSYSDILELQRMTDLRWADMLIPFAAKVGWAM
jgi:hypothetical protein